MKETTRQNMVRSDIWSRALFMVFFGITYSFAEAIIALLAIFQFFAVLIVGHVNQPLLQFGKNLSVYMYEILEFETFNTEIRPFPFSPWPEEEHGGDGWLDEERYDERDEDQDEEHKADLADEIDSAESLHSDQDDNK